MRATYFTVVMVTLFVWKTTDPAAAAVRYRLTDIGLPLGFDSASPAGINDAGQVVVTATGPFPVPTTPFLWTNGSGYQELPIPIGFDAASAAGINNNA